MIYPQKLNSKKGEIILKVFVFSSIILAFILLLINKLTTPNVPWAQIANCGIIYTWIVVIYSIRRNTNIGGHVLLQILAISLALLYIDKRLGYLGWSMNLGIPIVLIASNVTMFVLTIISYKKYIKYAIYQLVIVLLSILPFIIMSMKNIELSILGIVAIGVSILNFIVTICLCYKDIKEAVLMKVHM